MMTTSTEPISTASAGSDASEIAPAPAIRRTQSPAEGLRWDQVPLKLYKEDGTHFKSITRQVLFGAPEGLESELRYFEILPGGHSTLERHEHVHAVIILTGTGHVLIEDRVESIGAFDLVHVPPLAWHQFRATGDEPLGFLCLVPCDRDRPMRPTEEEAESLRSHPTIGSFVRI